MAGENAEGGSCNQFLAHSENKAQQTERLAVHLQATADRAQEFAAAFGAGELARIAGLLHDLGKYADQFQRRVRHLSREPGRDHSLPGALLTAHRYHNRGLLATLAIEGHHIGLQSLVGDWQEYCRQGYGRVEECPTSVTDPDVGKLATLFTSDGLCIPDKPPATFCLSGRHVDDMLDARMLFSALVDADFIETEAHFEATLDQPRNYRTSGPPLPGRQALAALDKRLAELGKETSASLRTQQVRAELLEACRLAAGKPPGLYTLSAPTGSGKTLAMLAFALRHAIKHNMRRIVLVMPYLNIIDQTANVYGKVFSGDNALDPMAILEHHSLADPPAENDTDRDSESSQVRLRRLLAQNWDAPIILTTHVQYLESLFANRPSSCRKLHRLAGSIILFDEVQTLPRELAAATLAALSRLAQRYGSTVVLATATQPAFTTLESGVLKYSAAGWKPAEIVSQAPKLFQALSGRVKLHWRHETPLPLNELAAELSGQKRALCILNLKRHATELAGLLKADHGDEVRHLSTAMCPAHRRAVLEEVTARLKAADKPAIRLIATQCVEAGVDLDFPVVYRALAPLEAIAQAAGRCNRNDNLPSPGEVFVFTPDGEGKGIYPPGYQQAADITAAFLAKLKDEFGDLGGIEIIQDPQRLRDYYRMLYSMTGTGTPQASTTSHDLHEAIEAGNFVKVAQCYRLIDQDSINILVPYDQGTFDQLVEQGMTDQRMTGQAIRAWIGRARMHAVVVPRPGTRSNAPIQNVIEPIRFGYGQSDRPDSWFRLLQCGKYDSFTGLVVEGPSYVS